MKYCPECGRKLEPKPNVCSNCGTEYKDGQKFCSECGTKLDDLNSTQAESLSNQQMDEIYEIGIEYENKAYGTDLNKQTEPNYIKAFVCFKTSAQAGYWKAQMKLGDYYRDGYGTKKNAIEAQEWYSRGFETINKYAKFGDEDFIYELGECYRMGNGVEQDIDKACAIFSELAEKCSPETLCRIGFIYELIDIDVSLQWLKKSANMGCSDAFIELGDLFNLGLFVEEDKKEALAWYKKAYEAGNAHGCGKIGFAYYYGTDVEENKAEAIKWFERAAVVGDYSCAYYAGEYYENGDGVEKNIEKAVEWYLISAEKQRDLMAMHALIKYYLSKLDFVSANFWYDKMIEFVNKDPLNYDYLESAQEIMKEYYEEDGSLTDYALQLSDNSSDSQTQFELAQHYFQEDDLEKAIIFAKRAVQAGHNGALDLLVQLLLDDIDEICEDYDNIPKYKYIYEDGSVVEGYNYDSWNIKGDLEEALTWFRRAATTGNGLAMFVIGDYYYNGWCDEADNAKALEWYRKSAEAGNPQGKVAADIVQLELKFGKSGFRRSTIYFVKDGTKTITKDFFKKKDYHIIYLPASVTSIEARAFAESNIRTILCESPKSIVVTDMTEMFDTCRYLSDISFLGEWNVSRVASMKGTFSICYALEDISPLAKWDVSNVRSMSLTFYCCGALKDISPLAKWDVSNVEKMQYMFEGCRSLKNISALANWKISKVESVVGMFGLCYDLSDFSVLKSWTSYVKKVAEKDSVVSWADGFAKHCKAITDLSVFKKWGLTELQIVQNILGRRGETQFRVLKENTDNSVLQIDPKSNQTTVPFSSDKGRENTAIDTCIPYVFFIKAVSVDITYDDGNRLQTNCGESGMPSWTGTGFLLSDGRFVTARHVVEPWAFTDGGGEVDIDMLGLNLVANNGGKVVAKFEALSSDGTKIQFSSDQCVINHRNDKVQLTNKGAKMVVARMSYDDTDYAYFQSDRTSGLGFNVSASSSLAMRTELVVLGFPLGIGANSDTDINPIYGSGIVAKSGLQNGVILTIDTNYEQGNSGGPVFITNSNGELEVIGLVSAGAGRTIGFIVPIAAVK